MGGNATFNLASAYGVGLLEFSFGKDGISSRLGMGGTNVSFQNLRNVAAGVTNLHKNSQINKTGYDKITLDALRSQWGFGNDVAKDQLDDIIKGDTVLKFDAEGSGVAQSITENGQKIIHINSSQNQGFIDLGLTLQHEAHRDGVIGDEESQQIETTNAVLGHTVMAKKMQNDSLYKFMMNDIIDTNQNLQDDMYLYSVSQAYQKENIFSDYVANMYNSSSDYWKLLNDGTLQKDGSGWLRDEQGKLILNKDGQMIGATGEETGLLNIMYGGTSGKTYDSFDDYQKEFSYKVMSEILDPYYEDGKEHTKENAKWDKTVEAKVNMNNLMRNVGDTVAVQVYTRYYDSTVDAIYAAANGIDIGTVDMKATAFFSMDRFRELYKAKSLFYESAGALFEAEDTEISGPYGKEIQDPTKNPKDFYKTYNNLHYGIDLIKKSGSDNILLGLSGIVDTNGWNEAEGWTLQMNYGYTFEDSFISTGIFGEYGHLKEKSLLQNNTFYSSTQTAGLFGNTGSKSTGAHLHYTVYTKNDVYYSDTTMKLLFGKNYQTDSMYNGSWRTVYNPTSFWERYK